MHRLSSLLTRLTLETTAHHAHVDEALHGPLEFPTVPAYRQYLCTLYGFQAPLEAAVVLTPGMDLDFMQGRLKAGRIASDVLAIGLTAKEFRVLARRHTIPAFRSVPEALGWLYVSERMTLQHETLRHRLANELSIVVELGGSFLAAYHGVAGERWRELGELLDQVAWSADIGDRVVAAANEAFRWLAGWIAEHAPSAIHLGQLASPSRAS